MKRIFTLLMLTFSMSAVVMAQSSECDGTRYVDYNAFPNVDVTSGVTFGSNTALGGGQVDLKMDVYEPAGDNFDSRPVIILAFGGSFIGGQRSDMEFLCRIFAKLGYVAIAPDYRVGFFLPNQVTTTLAVMRSMHDIKGCVRYLRKTVAEDGNPYGIDSQRIIVSGISAGAIGSIHAAYLDKDSEVPSYMANDTAGLGGVEGNSGSPGYSSQPYAVMSFSGTIGDTSWIEQGDIPISSIHDELDNVVPYGTTEVSVSGFPTGLVASGSKDIHIRAENLGIDNCLLTYRGVQGHVAYFSNGVDQQAIDFARDFCMNMVCTGGSDCHSVDAVTEGNGISEIDRNSIEVYPNPTDGVLTFTMDETSTVEVLDATGRVVLSGSLTIGKNRLDVSALPTGFYTLRTIGKTISTAPFIKK